MSKETTGYSKEANYLKLAEEAAELSAAITGYFNKQKKQKFEKKIFKELGDVIVVIERLVSQLNTEEAKIVSDQIDIKEKTTVANFKAFGKRLKITIE